MNRNTVFVAAAIALGLISGCGGGGGTPSGSGSTLNLQTGQYIEFLNGSAWMDPFNLEVGQSGTMVLANYDTFGTRTLLTGSGWSSTAGFNVAVTQTSPTTATFAVNALNGEFKFQVTSTILGNPTLFEQRGRVPSANATVSGRVVDLNIFTGLPSNNGIPHLNVDFFDAGGNVVGSARTMKDGRFTATVPTTAVEVMIDHTSIRIPKWFKSVYYQGLNYNPTDTACRISFPVVPGTNTMPASMGLPLEAGGPPPPPGGC